jgi:hypothetical protein
MKKIPEIVAILGLTCIRRALDCEYGRGNYKLLLNDAFGFEVSELWVISEKSSRIGARERQNWYRGERNKKLWLCEYYLDCAHGEFTLTALVNNHCN